MAVESDSLVPGRDLLPFLPFLGVEGSFAASCFLHCKPLAAAVLCAGFGRMHAAVSGGGTKNSHVNAKTTAMCLPAKPHPLMLCYKPVVSVMVWFWAHGTSVFFVLRST